MIPEGIYIGIDGKSDLVKANASHAAIPAPFGWLWEGVKSL
jgi:hypothetical protein